MSTFCRVCILGLALAAASACSAGQASDPVRTAAVPDPKLDAAKPAQSPARPAVAVFAGGCFWGVEAVFEQLRGVGQVTSGYAGGRASPLQPVTYDAVASGRTGFAESVRVEYDPSQISYGQLLKVFFSVAHDPTQRNRQGPDIGPQYRSAIFYADDEQKRLAQAYIAQLDAAGVYPKPIVTELRPLTKFHRAEDYHQDYMRRHPDQPYIVVHDRPKLENLKRRFPELVKGG